MRKKRFHIIFLLFFLTQILISKTSYCQLELKAEPARNFTIRDAINVALLNNKTIQIKAEEIEYAKANIMYAKSLFLPQISAALSYNHTEAVLTTDALRNNRKDTRIFTGYKNDNLFALSMDESIYNGGANIANLEQAKLGLKVQEETLRAGKLEVEFEAKRLFYGLLLAYETKRIAEDLVSQAQAHYEEVKSKFEQGTASKFDVLQSKVQVSRLIPQLVSANNAIDLIIVEFKKLLSLNMRDPIKIDGELKYSLVEIKEDDFLQEAYQRRPEMILKLLGVDINKWGIEFARAGWLPQISASGKYTYRSNDIGDMFNPRHDDWNLGIKGSIALFDGFATKGKVDEAKALYRQSILQKEDMIDQIALDVKDACLNMIKAKAIIDAEKDSIVEAREALRLAEIRFNNGVGINLDVLDAQVALAQVEQYLAQGIYDYIMAKAELDRIMGREFFKEINYGATN